MPDESNTYPMNQVLDIVRLLRPYWGYMAQSLLVGVMVMFFSIPGPYITKLLIDNVYPHRDFSLLFFVLVLGAAVSIALGLTNTLSDHFGRCVGINMSFDFQSRFYRHIQSLDFSFFDRRETGEIISRFGDMRSSISSIIGMTNTLTINCLQLAIFPAILLYINWKLALISLAVLPFDTLLVCLTKKRLRDLSQRAAERGAELSARTYESLSGIRTVQALGLEAAFFGKLRDLFHRVAHLQARTSLLQGGSGLLATVFRVAGTMAYGWYGWSQVLEGDLSLGTYMAFSGYVGYLYGPIESLIGLVRQLEMTLVHTNRFFEIYNLRPHIQDRPSLPSLPPVRGDIGFHNVSFTYDSDRWALRDIDLEIPAGTVTALVGRSGSGKSTLAKLIPRFYDPVEGYVTVDGRDVREYRLRSLRRQIGFAMQGGCLFQGTILENLTFERDIPLRDVEGATRAAYIHDFVSSLPEGYHTVVGEGGAQLSEGQKQRIALARVLLLDTPILILDEPTAALDMESESYIHKALEEVRVGQTVLIIAHRLSTIQSADEIVVLDDGRLAERGTHDLLLMQDGSYAQLHERAASV